MTSWLDRLLEAADEELEDVISDGIDSDDAQGIEDVSLADTYVKDADVSDDPDALVYDKTDCYSQDTEWGDEGIAGEIDVDLGDTETEVKKGNETPAVTESGIPASLAYKLYNEAVAEVVSESKKKIDAKFNQKIKDAKNKRRRRKAADVEDGLTESADVTRMINDIFSRF